MPIDARVEAEKLRKMYTEDETQKLARVLLTGESGTGKTYLLRTAPKPAHVDSFDPGGTKSVRDLIKKGDVIADTSYEDEDHLHSRAFADWKNKLEERIRGGYFKSIATYQLDSATTWTEAIMFYLQRKQKRIGMVPEWNKEYHPQKVLIRNYMRMCMNLPCHFILTGHLEPQKDKEGNIVARRFIMTGKGAIVVPLLFDEIWVSDSQEKREGNEYFIHTVRTGMYLARSRLSADGKLAEKETSDLRNILKKAGMLYEDKPSLFGGR